MTIVDLLFGIAIGIGVLTLLLCAALAPVQPPILLGYAALGLMAGLVAVACAIGFSKSFNPHKG